jgi:hypothetical protein
MDTTAQPPNSAVILVEFPSRPGVEKVSLGHGDLVAKSEAALDRTMAAIRILARRVADSVSDLDVKPTEINVEFGLKFDAQAGVLLSRAGMEASVNVKLVWKQSEE